MKKQEVNKLKKLKVVISAHIFATGPALELEEYLKDKVANLVFIGHPFMDRLDKRSFYRSYTKGGKVLEHKAFDWNLPGVLMMVKDGVYTLYWVFSKNKNKDLYIGSDNYLAFLGLILKKLGKVKKVIFYSIDYVPNRFNVSILNYVYHFFDKYCLKNCDMVWNVSERMTSVREEFEGIKSEDSAPKIVVPLGIWYDRIPKISLKDKEKNTIVFMGHILEKQGIDVVLEAISKVKNKIPTIKLKIVGKGPYEEKLKLLTKKLKIINNVVFLGYIESHEEVEKILARSTIAVATYKPTPDSFTYFADPGKIKNYIAASLPVIVTDVPAIAKVLEKKKCGLVVKYDSDSVANAILDLLTKKNKLKIYSDNARKFGKQFDWNNVFSIALKKSL